MTDSEAISTARVYRSRAGKAFPWVYIEEPAVCRECVIMVDFGGGRSPVVSRVYDQTKRWLGERNA